MAARQWADLWHPPLNWLELEWLYADADGGGGEDGGCLVIRGPNWPWAGIFWCVGCRRVWLLALLGRGTGSTGEWGRQKTGKDTNYIWICLVFPLLAIAHTTTCLPSPAPLPKTSPLTAASTAGACRNKLAAELIKTLQVWSLCLV